MDTKARLREIVERSRPDRYSRQQWSQLIEQAKGLRLEALWTIIEAVSGDGPLARDHLWWIRQRLLTGPGRMLAVEERAALGLAYRRRVLRPAECEALLDALVEAPAAGRPQLLREGLPAPSLPSLEQVHALLTYALRTLPFEAWPPGPYHLGGLRPDIGAANYAVLAEVLAGHLAEHPELAAGLRASAAKETELVSVRPDNAGGSLRPTLAKTMNGLPASAHRAFLDRLDSELLRLDALRALERRKKSPSTPVLRCVWRGARPQGDRVHAWLVQLEDGYGYLGKVGTRFRWHEGPLDEMLALVPDAQFAEAMEGAQKASG